MQIQHFISLLKITVYLLVLLQSPLQDRGLPQSIWTSWRKVCQLVGSWTLWLDRELFCKHGPVFPKTGSLWVLVTLELCFSSKNQCAWMKGLRDPSLRHSFRVLANRKQFCSWTLPTTELLKWHHSPIRPYWTFWYCQILNTLQRDQSHGTKRRNNSNRQLYYTLPM